MTPEVGFRLGLLLLYWCCSLLPGDALAEIERWKVHVSRVSGDNNTCIDGTVGIVQVERGRLRLYDLGMETQFPYFTVELEKDGAGHCAVADGVRLIHRLRHPAGRSPNSVTEPSRA